MTEATATTLEDLQDNKFYKFQDLETILKNLGVSYSIFTIRDYETWKCLDYKCGKRHSEAVTKCARCGGIVREPLITSPRTRGGGRGPGHRRYTKEEILSIVDVMSRRR